MVINGDVLKNVIYLLVFFRLILTGGILRVRKFLWLLWLRISDGHPYPFYPRVLPPGGRGRAFPGVGKQAFLNLRQIKSRNSTEIKDFCWCIGCINLSKLFG